MFDVQRLCDSVCVTCVCQGHNKPPVDAVTPSTDQSTGLNEVTCVLFLAPALIKHVTSLV